MISIIEKDCIRLSDDFSHWAIGPAHWLAYTVVRADDEALLAAYVFLWKKGIVHYATGSRDECRNWITQQMQSPNPIDLTVQM